MAVLGPDGGRFAGVLLPVGELPINVEVVYAAFLQMAHKEEFANWRNWWYKVYLPQVLMEGLMEPVKFTKTVGGLFVLQQANRDIFYGNVRGKLVVDPQE